MKFLTASKTARPIRLNNKTRAWAMKSMQGAYGDEALKTPYVEIDYQGFENLRPIKQYDYAINLIAKTAPIRVCEEELVSGSATLGNAIYHEIPAYYKGKAIYTSVSHLTVDYETALKKGVDYYVDKINKRLLDNLLTDKQREFLNSLLNVINAMKIYHKRYLTATKTVKPEVYNNLLQVPFKPAKNFHQAVQSIWFIFSFLRLTGNWPGIGRLDYLLGDYLKADLKSGALTLSTAREILSSMFIKGTEWIQTKTPLGSGDAQHYQNVVLAGIDENGKEITNNVTYLTLDIIEELGISDFPITVRINEKSPAKLLNKVARVVRHGGGVVAVYNENTVISAMVNYGYPLKEARNFANDGCWETQIPGKTRFGYMPFDSLKILQTKTLNNYENANYETFESLYNAYIKNLNEEVADICYGLKNNKIAGRNLCFDNQPPCSAVSLFENGCIENAKSYLELGPIYNVISPHIGGTADTVNALYAIKKAVYDFKIVSLPTFLKALKNNWQDNSELLSFVRSLNYYGTDNDEVDEIYSSVLHEFYLACIKNDTLQRLKFPAGASTFGREIEWAPNRLATPFGKESGVILAGNSSPTPGTDTEGATAVIKSYCKANLTEMVTGTALDIKLSPTSLNGSNGITAIKSLITGFIKLGGYFMQIDTVSAKTLKKAQENPSEFKTLSVRVSGWNARFITLTKEWQDMVIQRTEHNG